MAESVPIEIQIRARAKRRFRSVATTTIQVNADKPLSEALGEALGKIADGLRRTDEKPHIVANATGQPELIMTAEEWGQANGA